VKVHERQVAVEFIGPLRFEDLDPAAEWCGGEHVHLPMGLHQEQCAVKLGRSYAFKGEYVVKFPDGSFEGMEQPELESLVGAV
jgi:hypothetical protein